METIAYLHLALIHEEPTEPAQTLTLENLKLQQWFERQLVTHARIYLLSLVVILSVLGIAGEVLAQGILRLGSQGPDVTLVQERLRELGLLYQFPDGVFGPATRNAVIQFQRDYEINPDGVVGPDTVTALFEGEQNPLDTFDSSTLSTPYPPSYDYQQPVSRRSSRSTEITQLERGDRGPAVEQLQRRLRREGYNPGEIDGVFGPDTERAVRRFQRDNDLRDDGVAGRETLVALGLRSDSQENSYVVVVPMRGDDTLSEVQRYIRRATPQQSGRGKYVEAGAFDNRNDAESRSYYLRARGFDARVSYRP